MMLRKESLRCPRGIEGRSERRSPAGFDFSFHCFFLAAEVQAER
jgi:hypothetical protein